MHKKTVVFCILMSLFSLAHAADPATKKAQKKAARRAQSAAMANASFEHAAAQRRVDQDAQQRLEQAQRRGTRVTNVPIHTSANVAFQIKTYNHKL